MVEYKVDLDPLLQKSLKVRLYCNVKNSMELRSKLLTDDLKCCLIKPSLIVDPFQIALAANKALLSEKIKTKSIYTEILFNLSISKNITQSLQLFGAHDSDTNLLIATLEDQDSKIWDIVEGDLTSINDLKNLNKSSDIKKLYKLEDKHFGENLLDLISNKIIIKDFV